MFSKFSQDVIRAKYKNVHHASMLNVNNVNKKTLFQIDTGDNFCTSDFQYCINITY